MQQGLAFRDSDRFVRSISPTLELGAYEHLWAQSGATFRSIAERFRREHGSLPSDLVSRDEAEKTASRALSLLREHGVGRFGLTIHQTPEYPAGLRDARHPLELLYHLGWWNLVETPSVAVVGTREPSEEGREDARLLVTTLVRNGWTVVSGLAAGIDTVAHTTALDLGGRTIAVLGTPLCETYPKSNRELQKRIAEEHLLISQVPVIRYHQQIWSHNRLFFPERNVTMSALTRATIIVEASETSGTLVQARAALQQGRKLFILDRCFRDSSLKWPRTFAEQGAIRVADFRQIREALGDANANR